MPDHVRYVCPPGCEKPSCNYCDGGLFTCTVCGASEGELLPTCPGYKLTVEVKERCYAGTIKTVDDLPPRERCRCACGYTCGGPGKCGHDECLELGHFVVDCDHVWNGREIARTESSGAWSSSVSCSRCGTTALDHDCEVGP